MDYSAKTLWRFKTQEGEKAELQIVGAASQGSEQGLMAWLISMPGKSYKALLPERDFSLKLLAKFILHFRFCPQWREHFRQDLPIHPQVDVVLITGNVFKVDQGIARYVGALCDEGYTIIDSREGDALPHGRSAMLKFASDIPKCIEEASIALGWLGLDRTIEPVPARGWAHEYNQMLHLMLDDWLHGDVDSTGERYALYRDPLPFIPEWPKLPPQALVEHERKLRKDVERLNRLDTKVTFHDLVSLTSGRDSYSRMSLDELKRLSEEDPFLEHLEHQLKGREPAALARALRWRLRGLQLDLVLRKSEIESMLNKRDEKRREEFRLKKAMEMAIH